jgi:hypothetical protein
MGKSWPYKKAKKDHDMSSSRPGSPPRCDYQYVPVDVACLLHEHRLSIVWSNVHLPRQLVPQLEEGADVAISMGRA